MKAPDKCYITREKNGVIYSLSFNDNGGLEYIRKDALMEWARKNIEQFPLNDERNDKEIGFVTGICALIDKLNSM